MTIKSILLQKLLPALIVASSLLALTTGVAHAAPAPPPESPLVTESKCVGDASKCVTDVNAEKCKTEADDVDCNPVKKYLNPFIKVMSSLAGIAVVIGIIWGGIQYSMSEGDPQKVSTAKRHIRNSVLALLAYLFLYGFIRFLAPGQVTG